MSSMFAIGSRCAYVSAALETLGADSAWDERVTAYLRLDALQQAHTSFGPLAQANEASSLKHVDLEHRHGPRWKSVPEAREEARPLSGAALAVEAEWTAQYCEPFWQAARDLALTPAPTLAAALFKVRLIEWEDLDNDGAMTRDCFEIVTEDMARLAGEGKLMASRPIEPTRGRAGSECRIAQAIPMLTRHELAAVTERLIEHLDALEPDPDLEPDDDDTGIDDQACDEPWQDLEPEECGRAVYGIDQTKGMLPWHLR